MQETKKRWVQSLDRGAWQLQPIGSYRVIHNWRDLACTHTRMQDIYMWLPRWCSGKRTHLPMQEAQETWVRSLGWEDLLEEKMATHASILAWKFLWTEEPGRIQSMESQRARHDYAHVLSHEDIYIYILPPPPWSRDFERRRIGILHKITRKLLQVCSMRSQDVAVSEGICQFMLGIPDLGQVRNMTWVWSWDL